MVKLPQLYEVSMFPAVVPTVRDSKPKTPPAEDAFADLRSRIRGWQSPSKQTVIGKTTLHFCSTYQERQDGDVYWRHNHTIGIDSLVEYAKGDVVEFATEHPDKENSPNIWDGCKHYSDTTTERYVVHTSKDQFFQNAKGEVQFNREYLLRKIEKKDVNVQIVGLCIHT